jgi:hypothetical protein
MTPVLIDVKLKNELHLNFIRKEFYEYFIKFRETMSGSSSVTLLFMYFPYLIFAFSYYAIRKYVLMKH